MKTGLHLLLFFWMFSWSGFLFAQGDRCSSIQPFCAGDELLVFENSNYTNSSLTNAETGPFYGCLDDQPYPAWFFLQVRDSGNLEFLIRQSQNPDGSGMLYDVDFIVYGPFDAEDDYCSNASLSAGNVVDCSFDPAAIEEMRIPGAVADEIYVVLITNYSTEPGYISLQQTNANAGGSTDCSIISSSLGPDRNVCGEVTYTLDATNPQATSYTWFLFNETTGAYEVIPNETNPTLTISESGNYQVTVKSDVLDSEFSDDVYIGFFELPEAGEPSVVTGCVQEDEVIFDLQETSEELIGGGAGNFSTRFYQSQEDYENGEALPAGPVVFSVDEIPFLLGTVVNADTGCESLPEELELEVFSMPVLEIPEIAALCLDLNANVVNSVLIGEDLGPGFTYSWNIPNDANGDGVEDPVLELNAYPSSNPVTLTITHIASGCTRFYSTEVKAFAPPLNVSVDVEGNDFEGGYQVTATATAGFGDETSYEYRLDNGAWQESPVFRGVPGGTHIVEAREINGCGVATSGTFRLFGYPRFFTPNNDGYHDTWNVVNDGAGAVEKIMIFDRYGKLLKQLNPTGAGWDGNFNGRPMPADDYWFSIEYRDETGNLQVFRGHFSLVR
jgi:gliding motility-associated-like protein